MGMNNQNLLIDFQCQMLNMFLYEVNIIIFSLNASLFLKINGRVNGEGFSNV